VRSGAIEAYEIELDQAPVFVPSHTWQLRGLLGGSARSLLGFSETSADGHDTQSGRVGMKMELKGRKRRSRLGGLEGIKSSWAAFINFPDATP